MVTTLCTLKQIFWQEFTQVHVLMLTMTYTCKEDTKEMLQFLSRENVSIKILFGRVLFEGIMFASLDTDPRRDVGAE